MRGCLSVRAAAAPMEAPSVPPFAAVKRRVAHAIKRGAPLFDAGDTVGCERVYRDCYAALLHPGSDDAQPSSAVRELLSRQLERLQEGQPEHNAWELRAGFDHIMTLADALSGEADTVRVPADSNGGQQPSLSSSHALLKCSDPSCVTSFQSVSDAVAGGRSAGRVSWESSSAVFSGRVRGGENIVAPFASCRVQGHFPNCTPFSGFYVDCASEDGSLVVDFVAKDVDAAQSLVSFRAKFSPPAGSRCQRVLIPFWAFDTPERMGRPVIWPDLHLAAISEVGLRVSAPHKGPFSLRIREVGVYRE